MKVKVWGARGSVPAPGPGDEPLRRQHLLRRARALGRLDADPRRRHRHPRPRRRHRRRSCPKVNILLTHLHLDHIQGLMFFAPCFRAEPRSRSGGPSSPEASLEERIARYISAPLSPVEVRELPCDVSFLDTPATEWEIGPARIRAESVTHRGPTLGYRITDGDTTLAYISDHEPGPRRPARDARGRVDLGLRPRPRRRPADPRLPVHRRGVPRPRRLGPLAADRHPHLRPPGRAPSG